MARIDDDDIDVFPSRWRQSPHIVFQGVSRIVVFTPRTMAQHGANRLALATTQK